MKRKWSKEKIVESIQKLRKKNINMSAGNISKMNIPLFTAACSGRYFGGWSNAVKAAGIDYDQILRVGKNRRSQKLRKWSKEKILAELQRMDPPKLLKAYRDRLTLYSAARREFGSWKLALEAAGFSLEKGLYKNSKQIFVRSGPKLE